MYFRCFRGSNGDGIFTVSDVFEGEKHWADAVYTCTVTDGVPAASGLLSNGKFSFMYFPATGEIKKNAQSDNDFFFNAEVVPTVVIPWKIDEFPVASVNYPEKTIQIFATDYVHPFNTLDDGVEGLALVEGLDQVAPEVCMDYQVPIKTLLSSCRIRLKPLERGYFARNYAGCYLSRNCHS